MKILATFDGSDFAESIMPQLETMARLPDVEFLFLAIADAPRGLARRGSGSRPKAIADEVGMPQPIVVPGVERKWTEDKGQAIDRLRGELEDYLHQVAGRLPKATKISVRAEVASDVAVAIREVAEREGVDVIVMATHGRSGLSHAIFGSVTEEVVRSGVAPVLIVHPPKQKAVKS